MTSPVPHQAIYRRWRAQTFGEIVGQEAVVETLRNAVRTDRVSHAVLFVGPRGTGKTSLARILAKAVNCTDLQDGDACDRCPSCVAIREGVTLDLVEIDAATNRGIDDVRELRERLPYPPGELRRKVYILDEAHQITLPAWNALLKSIEEPPPFVNFMFASTEPSGFPPAILSRLQRFDVRRLTTSEIEGKLERILEGDGRTADPAALRLIATLAAGGMRDAESMLDQLLASAPDTIDEARVRDLLGLADAEAVDGFITALIDGDAASGIALLDALEERGRDARILLDQVIEAIRTRLVASLTTGDGSVTPGLADAARRLAAIDPDRAGVGGLRLQLELALFREPGRSVAGVPGPIAEARAADAPAASPAGSAIDARVTTPTKAVASAAPPIAPTPRRASGPASSAHAESPPAPALPSAPASSSTPPAASGEPASAPTSRKPSTPAPTADVAPPTPTPPASTPPAASAPAPTPTGSAVPPPSDDAALEAMVAAWPRVIDLLSHQPAIKPLITACRPVAIDGAIVTIGFPEEQGFLREAAERKRAPIEAGIAEVLGHEVAIRCVVANIEVPPPLAADDLRAEAGRIFGDLVVDVGEVN